MTHTNYILTTTLGNGKRLKPVIRTTEKGRDDYANRQYRKYGDTVTVEAGHFDNELNWVDDCTYHA